MTERTDAPVVMVVDDAPANLQLLQEMLRAMGYGVRPFPKGSLALRAAANNPPDLVLLDVNMPEMDGYEVCRRIRQDDRLKDTPVIFLSASSDPVDKARALSSGGDDYLAKPFLVEEVKARVETHLRLSRYRTELERLNERVEEAVRELLRGRDHLDIERLVDVLTGTERE